jgi:formate--tetrahydrofolate ligase
MAQGVHGGTLAPIDEIASSLGLAKNDIEQFGLGKAKITYEAMSRLLGEKEKRGKLVLVTAITPTKAGEGKTTTSIGLAQALWKLGKKSLAALREPSLGPVFGMKGGGTGGGKAQLVPMADINLHCTGDLHAITTANNLLSALADNHIFYGNQLNIDSRTIQFKRAMDMNERALRDIVQGLGGKGNGYPRQSGYLITAASEVMAILCLADSMADLKLRLANIIVGQDTKGKPVKAGDLQAVGSMAALLRDALRPNLVQTFENTPAFVHGGPFGNIAHGCSSVLATRLALRLSEIVVTEAGFGADLGFEKYCDIVASPRLPELAPDAVVMVVTVKALKLHGGVAEDALAVPNTQAVTTGFANVERHAAIVAHTKVPFVIAINRFHTDSKEEIDTVLNLCAKRGWRCATSEVFARGGDGAIDLARLVIEATGEKSTFVPLVDRDLPLKEKLDQLAKRVYGAARLEYDQEAEKQLRWLNNNGYGNLHVCVAKTQYSLSDDPHKLNSPSDFKMRVRAFQVSGGAGFVVALMGEILTLPGLPKQPAAFNIDVDSDGCITGLT